MHQDLINRCRKGDRKAQFDLYKLYYKAMYNTALRIVGDSCEAEDIMQEAFLSAFGKLGTYSRKVSFGAWLKKIVINRSLDVLRKQKPVFEELNESVTAEAKEPEAAPPRLNAGTLRQALMELPAGYRVVFSLYYLEGYDHGEIAGILQISPGSSRSQLLRAKQKLKSKLSRQELIYNN